MQKILILTDFTAKSENAARYAAEIAERTHSDLLVFNAFPIPQAAPPTEPVYPVYDEFSSARKAESEKLRKFAASVQRAVVDRTSVSYFNEPGSLGENIRDVLRHKKGIWLIVMGDKKKDNIFSRFVFGSDTFAVLNVANCPVLLVPQKTSSPAIETIAFASNLERTDYKALRRLVDFASYFKAKIIVTHVYPHAMTIQEKVDQYETYLHIIKKVDYPLISYQDFMADGDGIAEGLLRFIRKNKPGILAMVNRKHPFFEKMLHHSATEEILEAHRLPVLVLPADRQ